MSQDTTPDPVSKKVVVYRVPNMDAVKVLRDVEYGDGHVGTLNFDIYYPPDFKSGMRLAAVIFVAGYPDEGFERIVGCKLKEMGAYVSWGKLTAASGLIAITYTNREPVADVQALLRDVRQRAAELGIDENRIGLWACSGNVPLALSVLMQEAVDYLKCAVLCYGIMLDLDGSTYVAEAAKTWGFSNPCAGRSVADLPQRLPLFIVRAGLDETPHLNETIDGFMAKALSCNLPVTFVNHPAAPHAFDLLDDTQATREIIRRILAFMQFHL